jgi:hypothetical protein
MADTGARLNILTHMSLGIVQCPPAQYFKDAAAEVLKHSKHSCLSIEEAMLLLESFEKEAIKKIDVSTAEALTRRLLNLYNGACMKFQWQILNIVKQMGSFPALVFGNSLVQIFGSDTAYQNRANNTMQHNSDPFLKSVFKTVFKIGAVQFLNTVRPH